MPTRDSDILTTRVDNETIKLIKQRLNKKKPTVNAWMNWAIKLGLRRHG